MTKRFTELELKARVVPQSANWPRDLESWQKLHEATDVLRHIVSAVNEEVARIEGNADLSPDGVARQRAEVGAKASVELESFGPLAKAEKAVRENIEYLNEKMTGLPKPSSDVTDSIMSLELRGFIRAQPNPINTVLANLHDARLVGAVLNAPPLLSGLKDEEIAVVRDKARVQLHPAEFAMQQRLEKALADLQEGLASAARLVRERAGIS